jgi:acyl carrier protein
MADDQADIAARVIRTIAKTQGIDPTSFSADSSFEEMNVDSLDGINIVFAVETEFDINVPDEAVKALRGVRDVIDGVEKLVAEKPAVQPAPVTGQ